MGFIKGFAPIRFDYLDAWRRNILRATVDRMCSIDMASEQKQVGVWRFGDRLPYPGRDVIRLTRDGLNFTAEIDGQPVFFSVWLQMGEVRCGVRVPLGLISGNSSLEEQIRECFNGDPTNRVSLLGDGMFFDWIFTDGFAGYNNMVSSMGPGGHGEVVRASIADRIAGCIIHLYMSVTGILIDTLSLTVGFQKVRSPGNVLMYVMEVEGGEGGMDSLTAWLEEQDARIVELSPGDNGAQKACIEAFKALDLSWPYPSSGPFVIRGLQVVTPSGAIDALVQPDIAR